MIAVSGLQRSGTALMMQTLKHLGLSVAGYKYHEQFSNKELNPKGYYDLPLEDTIHGVWANIWKKDAIKLYPAVLNISDFNLIEKLIICKRNKTDVFDSTLKLLKAEEWFLKANKRNATNSIVLGEMILESLLEEYKNPVLFVNYEDMLNDTKKTITKVAEFVTSNKDIKDACENVFHKELVCQ